MKKMFLVLALFSATVTMAVHAADVFEPYQHTNLRLPSVPLVVIDPYFSVWSPYDRLTDGSTRLWTDAEMPLEGLLRVDGTTYRWMGADRTILQTVVPMADEGAWEAQYMTCAMNSDHKPAAGWEKPTFDAKDWRSGKAAFGSADQNFVRTRWDRNDSEIYVRRTVELSKADLEGDLWLVYSHDDSFAIWFNGTKVYDTGDVEIWKEGVRMQLTAEQKALLHEGTNVIASRVLNHTGGAYLDFGIYRNVSRAAEVKTAIQKSVDVLATNTYYTFACGPVELDVVFTAPFVITDLALLSSPAGYISARVRSTDGKEHDAQLYIGSTPEMAVNNASQPTISTIVTERGRRWIKSGTIEQPILAKSGDGICIDWGYFMMPELNGTIAMGSSNDVKHSFITTGRLPKGEQQIVCRRASDMPTLAWSHDFGRTSQAETFTVLAYDEVYDIQYMYKYYRAYWATDGGNPTVADFVDERLVKPYAAVMEQCRQWDKTIYDDALAAGGVKYAEILSASYRHVIAAHKIFKDDQGNVLFFSKENNSNGCVNTVDLTYPSAPLFLLYNPELEKGMMTSIFDYSLSGRWTKPFAAHDLGTYPKANGQVYGGDMPLEEAGNMLTLAATLCKIDGDTHYVDKYWDIITTWADYLVENGQDPANQLCTDDFAGHWAHNCNLSAKAIMGVAGYALMAEMKGDAATAEKYMSTAKTMAEKWEKDAREGDHYRLAFDRENTWSQKYNMVWDKLWNINIFPGDPLARELKYYEGVQNRYGLPLDCRKDYTKNDWIMWSASVAKDQKQFDKFVNPLWDYINETESRVPISDWYDTKTGRMVGFKARSVIGGFWMRVLEQKMCPQPSKATKGRKAKKG